MSKIQCKANVKLYVYAGIAKPSPKIGQALGPLGINMMAFCKEFNERTTQFKPDSPMRVLLKAYVDRSFTFVVKPPPTVWFLLKAAGKESGTEFPNLTSAGFVSAKYIYEIAKIKKEFDPDLKDKALWSICTMIMGTCKSMGIKIVDDIALLPRLVNPIFIK